MQQWWALYCMGSFVGFFCGTEEQAINAATARCGGIVGTVQAVPNPAFYGLPPCPPPPYDPSSDPSSIPPTTDPPPVLIGAIKLCDDGRIKLTDDGKVAICCEPAIPAAYCDQCELETMPGELDVTLDLDYTFGAQPTCLAPQGTYRLHACASATGCFFVYRRFYVLDGFGFMNTITLSIQNLNFGILDFGLAQVELRAERFQTRAAGDGSLLFPARVPQPSNPCVLPGVQSFPDLSPVESYTLAGHPSEPPHLTRTIFSGNFDVRNESEGRLTRCYQIHGTSLSITNQDSISGLCEVDDGTILVEVP